MRRLIKLAFVTAWILVVISITTHLTTTPVAAQTGTCPDGGPGDGIWLGNTSCGLTCTTPGDYICQSDYCGGGGFFCPGAGSGTWIHSCIAPSMCRSFMGCSYNCG